MNDTIQLTISKSERAELEALLDAYIAEIRKDKGEHERLMAEVDKYISEAREQHNLIRANLEKFVEKAS